MPQKEDLIIKSINSYIERSQSEQKEADRLKSSDKAYFIASKTDNDSLLYKALYNKIQTDISYRINDSINYYFEELKVLSKTRSYKAGYCFLKGLYFNGINADSSFVNYEKSQKLYALLGEDKRAGYSLMMMSQIQRIAADYVGAESTMTEALKHFDKSKSKEYHNHIYNEFGLIYKGLYDYESALDSYQKSLRLTDKKNIQAITIIENNIALIYRDKKAYDKAIKIFQHLNSKSSLDSDLIMKAKILSNLGYSIYLSKKGNGLPYLKQAETIQDNNNDTFGRLANYLISAEAYGEIDKQVSKSYAYKAYNLAKQLNNGEERLKALELLSKTAVTKKETDKLLQEYVTLNDSITVARQTAKKQFAKIRYDSSEAEKAALLAKAESAESRLQAERTQTRNIMLLALVTALIVGIIFWYRFMKKKNTIDKLKASYSTETRISRKVHDELANDVYNVMNFTNSQNISIPEKKERLMNYLDSLYKRTRDISKENSTIETGENFAVQLKEMLSEYQNENVNVASRGVDDVQWVKVEGVKKIAIYRILQELMVNMAKHSEATVSVIGFKAKGRNVEIDYFDNGVGIPSDKIIFRNGLLNAENRITAIGGRLIFESVPQTGLKIKIVFPV